MTNKLYRELATLIDAYHRCVKTGNDFARTHAERIADLVSDNMPSGNGFDGGTQLDFNASAGDKLVFTTSYHHMNENGFYDGWTDHVITVKPSMIHGFTMTISGRDRDGFKEYAYDVFSAALDTEV